MKKTIFLTATLSSAITVLGIHGVSRAAAGASVKLDNARVKVSELVYEPGVPRPRSIRPTDQVIVFLDDCKYERTDSETHEKTVRQRKSGDVIWHTKGEDAPVLVNLDNKPYRTLIIELK
jgi:hypothetical protein